MKVLEQKENPLFSRKEVVVLVERVDATPSRVEVLKQLSEFFKASPDTIVIDSITQKFGERQATVNAKIYSNANALKKTERAFKLARGKHKEKKEGVEKKANEGTEKKASEE